jgi:hypothetical protein
VKKRIIREKQVGACWVTLWKTAARSYEVVFTTASKKNWTRRYNGPSAAENLRLAERQFAYLLEGRIEAQEEEKR